MLFEELVDSLLNLRVFWTPYRGQLLEKINASIGQFPWLLRPRETMVHASAPSFEFGCQ